MCGEEWESFLAFAPIHHARERVRHVRHHGIDMCENGMSASRASVHAICMADLRVYRYPFGCGLTS
jgi:hypothetical protein